MSRIHSTLAALIVGATATAGLYAAVHTVRLGQKTPAPSVSTRDLAARQAKLDAWGRSLKATLSKRPPALPKLPHFAPVPPPAAPPPSVPPAQPKVTYVKAPTVVRYKRAPATTTTPTTTTTSWSDDGSGDDGSGDGGGDSEEETEMRSHGLRLYVFSITLLVFFVLWAVIAARPWASARNGASPALDALQSRERHLRHEARVVERTVHRRWAGYRRRLHAREAQIRALERRHAAQLAAANAAAASAVSYSAAPASRVVTLAPQVRVVTLPPAGPSTSSGSSHP